MATLFSPFYLYSIKLKLNWIDSKFCWLLVLSALIVWAAVHLHAEPINVSLSLVTRRDATLLGRELEIMTGLWMPAMLDDVDPKGECIFTDSYTARDLDSNFKYSKSV